MPDVSQSTEDDAAWSSENSNTDDEDAFADNPGPAPVSFSTQRFPLARKRLAYILYVLYFIKKIHIYIKNTHIHNFTSCLLYSDT